MNEVGCVTQKDREKLHGHKGAVVWFTGLSGAGKSTIAHVLERLLHETGNSTYLLDGDKLRQGLCGDLDFSEKDRLENIRRIGEMAKLFADAGIIAIAALISPYANARDMVRSLIGKDRFVECYVRCPVEIRMSRDPKGLYQKAMQGVIENFTGISAPYEPPEMPDILIETHEEDAMTAARNIMMLMMERKIIPN